jgi:hypothetical protein
MANSNNLFTNLKQNLQHNSVSWGALILWVFGLAVVLTIVWKFANI